MGSLTADKFRHMVREKFKPDTPNMQLIHAAMGISGEAGELVDCIKKHVIYGQEMDMHNLIEELGDVEFYLEAMRQRIGLDREDILEANIQKLSVRYKGGFTTDESKLRADKRQLELFEQGMNHD